MSGPDIRLKEACELCCFVACSFDHIGMVIIRVEVNQVLAREMKVQANNIRGFTMHVEMEDLPGSFRRPQETAINMFANLVVTLHLE